jgi:hypothetical protein
MHFRLYALLLNFLLPNEGSTTIRTVGSASGGRSRLEILDIGPKQRKRKQSVHTECHAFNVKIFVVARCYSTDYKEIECSEARKVTLNILCDKKRRRGYLSVLSTFRA